MGITIKDIRLCLMRGVFDKENLSVLVSRALVTELLTDLWCVGVQAEETSHAATMESVNLKTHILNCNHKNYKNKNKKTKTI